jgi:hypothetical protein
MFGDGAHEQADDNDDGYALFISAEPKDVLRRLH